MIEVKRGPKNQAVLLYFGQVRDLYVDPLKLKWTGKVSFFQYSIKLGREMLNAHHKPLQLTEMKWRGVLPTSFRLSWRNVWDPGRTNKEATLLWQLWHKAVAVNRWRGKISTNIDTTCQVCNDGEKKA